MWFQCAKLYELLTQNYCVFKAIVVPTSPHFKSSWYATESQRQLIWNNFVVKIACKAHGILYSWGSHFNPVIRAGCVFHLCHTAKPYLKSSIPQFNYCVVFLYPRVHGGASKYTKQIYLLGNSYKKITLYIRHFSIPRQI